VQLKDWLEENLPRVEKPARYLGNEVNTVHKPVAETEIGIALAFPDIYEVGMSHLGLKILYHIVNMEQGMVAERVFAPAGDMAKLMRREGIPLFTLESARPVREFDLVGFTLQYELSYSTVLDMLSMAAVPLMAGDRGEGDPLVIGGGPCAFNPEPLADFFDLFLLGDGEEAVTEILSLCRQAKAAGKSRLQTLKSLAAVPGVYIPSFYRPSYGKAGEFISISPVSEVAPARPRKRVVQNLDAAPYPDKMIVPYLETVHDRAVLEVFRGCTRGCRFCQAGIIYRPVRERSLESLEKLAFRLAETTGYEELSLASLSTGDYSRLQELVDRLQPRLEQKGINLSLPSLRIDSFSVELAKKLGRLRKSGLTFAPEAGTQEMRNRINKNVAEADLLQVAEGAFISGWDSIKLYFMLGLPGESDEDLEGIALLARKVRDLHRQVRRNNRGVVTVSVSTFVPKAHTPFQWEAQIPLAEVRRRQQLLRQRLRGKGLRFSWHDPEASLLEADFSRGDRRLGKVLLNAHRRGARLDGWSENFSFPLWQDAFRDAGLELGEYAYREYGYKDPLPWDHLDVGVRREFLVREHRRALEGKTTPDCREGNCQGCGIDPCPQLEAVKK